MDYLEYLFAGFAVFWAGLFGYLLWLQARLRALARELERLEERLAEADAPVPEASLASGEPARPTPAPPPRRAPTTERGAE
ncbi:MAG: CcmD family protein [Chloroflexi bacterium]|nr:CcmD family protein [Chloroflexota bacterium]